MDTDFSTDKWIVISDDPNVDGDLTYKVYDYNPDEPPKTADPVMLVIPAIGLLASATAMICLLRRKSRRLYRKLPLLPTSPFPWDICPMPDFLNCANSLLNRFLLNSSRRSKVPMWSSAAVRPVR